MLDGPRRHRLASAGGLAGEPDLEPFDVAALHTADLAELMLRRHIDREAAQGQTDCVDRGGPQRDAHLVQVGSHRGCQSWRSSSDLVPLRIALVRGGDGAHETLVSLSINTCASIASDALRYSLASQSLARWR